MGGTLVPIWHAASGAKEATASNKQEKQPLPSTEVQTIIGMLLLLNCSLLLQLRFLFIYLLLRFLFIYLLFISLHL